MSAWRPKKCKRCGVSRSVDVSISKNGYCPACGLATALDAVRSMHDRVGVHHERFERARAEGRVGRPRKGVGGTPS